MKVKHIIITTFIGVATIGGIIFINKKINESGPILSLKEDVFNVEYGNGVSTSVYDYVIVNQAKAKLQGNPLKTAKLEMDLNTEGHTAYSSVGSYPAKITFKDDNEEKTLEFTVNVEDTTEPEIKQYYVLECYVGEDIDLSEAFGAKDLSKTTIEIDDSKVDYNKAGQYDIIDNATDESQNTSTLKTTVNIKNAEIDFKLKNNTLTLRTNQTTTIIPDVHGDADKIKFEIEDDTIATVSSNGKIKPVKEGTTTVKASIDDVSATFTLIVL